MHELYDTLLSACDHYQAMQQDHLHCLATEAQPDMERLDFEQARLSADFQNLLTALVYHLRTARHEPGLLDALRSRLVALLEGNAVLAERLNAYRATLIQQRAAMQQGQKALGGYGQMVTPLSPRLVDIAS